MNRDLLVARIISGIVPLRVYCNGQLRRYQLRKPSPLQMLELEEAYEQAYHEAEVLEQMHEDDLLEWLWEEGLWDESKEKTFLGIPKDIEKLKVGLYENRHDQDVVKHTKKALEAYQVRYNDLFLERHSHDHLSCLGYAKTVRLQLWLAMSLFDKDSPVFPGLSYLEDRSELLQDVTSAWTSSQLPESTFRSLARSSPWRPIWQSRESATSLFGIPACDYTEEQRQLVAASQLYEQIRQHPECPAEFVLEDDDMLDGWLILEHRKHSKAEDEKDIESTIRNPSIKNSQEVFKVVGKNKDLANKVAAMNSEAAKKTIENRFASIEQKGKVGIQNLPDMKQRVTIERNNAKK